MVIKSVIHDHLDSVCTSCCGNKTLKSKWSGSISLFTFILLWIIETNLIYRVLYSCYKVSLVYRRLLFIRFFILLDLRSINILSMNRKIYIAFTLTRIKLSMKNELFRVGYQKNLHHECETTQRTFIWRKCNESAPSIVLCKLALELHSNNTTMILSATECWNIQIQSISNRWRRKQTNKLNFPNLVFHGSVQKYSMHV